jgi:hypothetical protein
MMNAPQQVAPRGNAFQKVIERDAAAQFRLGCPSADEAARLRRSNTMAAITGGRGFRAPPTAKEPRVRLSQSERPKPFRGKANTDEAVAAGFVKQTTA